MTPIEKAKELVEKYVEYVHPISDHAKQCAIICCDELVKELQLLRKPEYTTFIAWEQLKEKEEADTWDGYEIIDYWQSVKTEIQNL